MKKIFKQITLASLFMFTFSLAQAGIKEDMQAIGGLFKAIFIQVNDASLNADSAAKAGQMLALFDQTSQQTPDSIKTLPVDQQGPALLQYQQLMEQMKDVVTKLQNALIANDNATAVTLLQEMNALRSQGHSAFKP